MHEMKLNNEPYKNIKIVKEEVIKLLDSDNSGHGMDHINRVVNIAADIAKREKANVEIAIAIALLHDADDYKLFGLENSKNLTNTKMILEKTTFNSGEKEKIINSIKTIGYSKRLEGITPEILEAKIVSDADMIDAMGATGILRSYHYNITHDNLFFDKDIFPNLDLDAETYKHKTKGTVVTHMFEKLLKLKDYMLTKAGKEESLKRYKFMISFLRAFFEEENALEWLEYLDNYIKNQ